MWTPLPFPVSPLLFPTSELMANGQIGGLEQARIDPDQYQSTATTRAATPTPPPFVSGNQPFSKRSREEQIYLIRPHLHAVIEDEYLPSRARVDSFYNDDKPLYITGDYSEAELSNIFVPELKRWLLRPHSDNIVSPSCPLTEHEHDWLFR